MEEGTIRSNPTGQGDRAARSDDGWDRVDVLGVQIACVDLPRTLDTLRGLLDSDQRTYLCLVGVHGVMEAQRSEAVLTALQDAGMALPDGMPMVWAGRKAGSAEIGRVYGPDLMLEICEEAALRAWPVYFYGGAPGVADRLAERMTERFMGLEVAGTYCPPIRDAGAHEAEAVIDRIARSGARIVFVGLSTPKQDLWMKNHLERIGGSVVLLGVGAAFDIHAGLRPDAPKWIGRMGLQWFYRLLQEPRRLWRRYTAIVPGYLLAVRRTPPRLTPRETKSR